MDYTYANTFWQERDAKAKKMPHEQLLQQITLFLKEHTTCALATGFGTKIRCTTLAYQYRKGKICIFSEGGEKFGLLEHNKEVALTMQSRTTDLVRLKGYKSKAQPMCSALMMQTLLPSSPSLAIHQNGFKR